MSNACEKNVSISLAEDEAVSSADGAALSFCYNHGMGDPSATYPDSSKRAALLLVLALSAHFAAPWLWNDFVYPATTAAFSGSRIMYSLVPLCLCGALLFGRARARRLLHSRVLALLGLLCAPLGTLVAVLSLSLMLHPAFILLGIALFGAGRLFVFLLIGRELFRLDLRIVVPVVVASLLLSGAWDAIAGVMPLPAAYALAAVLEGGAAALSLLVARFASLGASVSCAMRAQAPLSKRDLEEARLEGAAMSSDADRGGFLRRRLLVSSSFLIAIGAFFMVFGFSGRYFDEGAASSVAFFCSFVPLLVIGLWIAIRRRSFSLDPIYRCALIFTALGFVCIAFPSVVPPHAANMIVMGGSHCFVVIYWVGLCSACQGRPRDAAAVLVQGRLFASGGTLTGILLALGMLSLQHLDPQVESFAAAIMALLYMVISLVVLRNLDYIVVLPQDDGAQDGMGRLFETRGLTSREQEVALLLARGRNASYIQDKLFISRNTVKSHMKHIYAKLGVHTQQELLSLFEDAGEKD